MPCAAVEHEYGLLWARKTPDDPQYVLKDCWVDFDRSREGEILQEVTKEQPGTISNTKHFLETAIHGDVMTSHMFTIRIPSIEGAIRCPTESGLTPQSQPSKKGD